MLHRYWNIVRHACVFIVWHRKKGEAYVDCPHCQSVVTRPNPHLHKVISAGQKKGTCYIMELLLFIANKLIIKWYRGNQYINYCAGLSFSLVSSFRIYFFNFVHYKEKIITKEANAWDTLDVWTSAVRVHELTENDTMNYHYIFLIFYQNKDVYFKHTCIFWEHKQHKHQYKYTVREKNIVKNLVNR